ncbi:MAG: hypothetical protein IJQ86_06465 [Spirochaetia bacterium]|nr:hypothetical protein [Spirochaetia bacterium]
MKFRLDRLIDIAAIVKATFSSDIDKDKFNLTPGKEYVILGFEDYTLNFILINDLGQKIKCHWSKFYSYKYKY